MTIPSPQKQESQAYSAQKQAWKWEKRHWLLVLAIGCLALWWFGTNLKEAPLIQKAINFLPVLGGGAFALEAITKLAQ
jgi:ABC-type phosphate/phosphonate transport system permease subunit